MAKVYKYSILFLANTFSHKFDLLWVAFMRPYNLNLVCRIFSPLVFKLIKLLPSLRAYTGSILTSGCFFACVYRYMKSHEGESLKWKGRNGGGGGGGRERWVVRR